MKATLSLSQLYWNASLITFFMRRQSYEHFVKFYRENGFRDRQSIEEWAEERFDDDLDQFEEYCHENTEQEMQKDYDEYMGR